MRDAAKKETVATAVLLIAYLAVLLKLIVFKYPGVHFAPAYNFVPLKTIVPYLMGSPSWGVARYNLLGNIIPFMPLGMLVPFLCRRFAWQHGFAAGCAMSLVIEILQIILHKGTFDVDDLLLNTLGTVLGFTLVAAVRRPKRDAR